MPKSFTDAERAHIREQLTREAEACLSRYGARRATVDEIVRRANIPKGTFYLFYDTKELLFLDVIMKFHDRIQRELLSQVEAMRGEITEARLTALILSLFERVESSFLYPLITGGDLELIMRKLPPEAVAAHARVDEMSFEQLAALLPIQKPERVEAFSAALRGVFFSMLHKREIGEAHFSGALEIMIRGVVLQMFGEDDA